MSRWLKSVNTLLEKLDDQVETAVEEHEAVMARDEGASTDAVDSILAKRGYMEEVNGGEEVEGRDIKLEAQSEPALVEETGDVKEQAVTVKEQATVPVDEDTAALKSVESQEEDQPESNEQTVEPLEEAGDIAEKVNEKVTGNESPLMPPAQAAEPEEEYMEEVLLETVEKVVSGEEALTEPMDLKSEDPEPVTETNVPRKPAPEKKPPAVEKAPAAAPVVEKPSSAPPRVTQVDPLSTEPEYKKATTEAREAQKECRTLRRHVVSLNSELEAAEAEIQAQRTELERAAERMEKDRARQKEEKDRLVARHTEELKALKAQHEQTVAGLKTRSDQQVEDARKRMKDIEERRMQEGGDWTKEMENALQREQESVRRMANLEDEKSTLLSQISSLQAQQAALENRLDSVSQTADNAMEREREAEDRLDAALSMHARQLTQRQARESELERTIADLGAALVVARNKEINRLKSESNDSTAGDRGGNDVSALRARLEDSEDHLETLKAQLDLERQRSNTLQQELHEMSKERTEEASAAHAKQLQSDRKLADMSVTISRLQASVRDSKKASFKESRDSVYSSDDGDRTSQMKSLSEQVLKQQETIARNKSEISALKNRLRVAVGRADKAEEALSLVHDSDDLYDRMERAPLSGASDGGRHTMRRRGGRGNSSDAVSIRSAIRLNPGQGQNGEKIGKAIDAVDSFSVQTGKYLRSNPLARAGFLLYLLMVHVWTFLLIMFHTHGFETVHGDFGAGHQLPHGPHALMQAHEPPVSNP